MKSFAIISTILIIVFTDTSLFGQWQQNQMPFPIVQSYGTGAEGKLFMPGGTNFNYLPDVAIYDIATESWSSTPLIESRAKIASVVNGDQLFCGGGIFFEASLEFDLVEIYNIQTNAFIDSFRLTKPRVELSVAAV